MLRGSTKEEIEAHAESLKEHFAKDAAPVVDAGSPSTDEGQAGDPLREAIMQGL